MYINDEDFGITQEYVGDIIRGLQEVQHCLGYYESKQRQACDALSPECISLKRHGRTHQTVLEIGLSNSVKGVSKSPKFSRVLKDKELALVALLFCDSYIAALCESTGASYENFCIALKQTLDAVRHSQSITKEKECSADCRCRHENKEQETREYGFTKEMLEKDYPYCHFPCYNESCEKDYDEMITNEDEDKRFVNKCFEQELCEQRENAEEYAHEEQDADDFRRECGEYGYSKGKPHHHHYRRHHYRRHH